MTASVVGILLGLLVGLRHAFEADHLTAVSTLVAEAKDGRRGAWLGAIWGLGHTLALVLVGAVLIIVGARLPEHVATWFELGVAAMLIVLGVRSIARAARIPSGPIARHRHGTVDHSHADAAPHIHLAGRIVAWRPLVIGLIHGLAGSGALTSLVFAELPTTALRIAYITLFGIGSIAGMAIASGVAGVALRAVAGRPSTHRALALTAGGLSIVVGVLWGIPLVSAIAA